ncbi:MAG: GNAT family N-acetyltransferase [Candidatus Sericytochromatia bacterium]
MDFELQPILENEWVKIIPLKNSDFEILYNIASDPLIWEQHPNKDRYKKEVFENFFKGAIESKGAFLILDNKNNMHIGSSRYYDLDLDKSEVAIGYTFIARSHWGIGHNKAIKELMLEHAFKFVDNVIFHIGANNIRSQKAIEKIGANKIKEEEIAYYGEASKLNYVYKISSNLVRSEK